MDCAGGQKDLGTFNLYFSSSDSLPPETSISHEGIYYQYFFETGQEKEKIFSATYYPAVSADPFNGKFEYYVAIGLNSKYDGEGIKSLGRKPLNLLVLLDISGSMSSAFSSSDTNRKSKLEVAKETLYDIMELLRPDDRFGITLFDDKAHILQPVILWSKTDVKELKDKISKVRTQGSTALSAAMDSAFETLKAIGTENGKYNNRILNLTDAEPTAGDTDSVKLVKRMKEAADHKIYKTFIGMGIDFNTALVEEISKVPACGYFSVESSAEFKKMLTDNFDYFVTPIAFDVSVNMVSDLFEVERIYASPGNELPSSAGECVKMISLFPSAKEEPTTTKGGVVLVKLKPKTEIPNTNEISIAMQLKFADYEFKPHEDKQTIKFPLKTEYYASSSARKAIVLSRYVNLMKHWIRDTSGQKATPTISLESGILVPSVASPPARHSTKVISPHYRTLFSKFSKHLENQTESLSDEKLVLDLEEKISSLLSYISFDDIKLSYEKIKPDFLSAGGLPFSQISASITKELQGSPNEKQLSQLQQLVESDVFNSSDSFFEKFLTNKISRIKGVNEAELTAFLKESMSANLFTYMQPHTNRAVTRITNYTAFIVLHKLFTTHSKSVDAVIQAVDSGNIGAVVTASSSSNSSGDILGSVVSSVKNLVSGLKKEKRTSTTLSSEHVQFLESLEQNPNQSAEDAANNWSYRGGFYFG